MKPIICMLCVSLIPHVVLGQTESGHQADAKTSEKVCFDSHNNRGILLSGAGRLKEAEYDYDQAVRIQEQLVDEVPSRLESTSNTQFFSAVGKL